LISSIAHLAPASCCWPIVALPPVSGHTKPILTSFAASPWDGCVLADVLSDAEADADADAEGESAGFAGCTHPANRPAKSVRITRIPIILKVLFLIFFPPIFDLSLQNADQTIAALIFYQLSIYL
jgi:hypothetical protein